MRGLAIEGSFDPFVKAFGHAGAAGDRNLLVLDGTKVLAHDFVGPWLLIDNRREGVAAFQRISPAGGGVVDFHGGLSCYINTCRHDLLRRRTALVLNTTGSGTLLIANRGETYQIEARKAIQTFRWIYESGRDRLSCTPRGAEPDWISYPVLMTIMIIVSIVVMTKCITANLPDKLLREAMEVTGKGITDTLVEGLRRVRRTRAFAKAQALRGKIALKIDLEESRERRLAL